MTTLKKRKKERKKERKTDRQTDIQKERLPYMEFGYQYLEVFLINFIFHNSLSHNIGSIRAEVNQSKSEL